MDLRVSNSRLTKGGFFYVIIAMIFSVLKGSVSYEAPSSEHGSQTLKIGTLRGILRDIDMSPDEFTRRWQE